MGSLGMANEVAIQGGTREDPCGRRSRVQGNERVNVDDWEVCGGTMVLLSHEALARMIGFVTRPEDSKDANVNFLMQDWQLCL
jgi:hypothetical protein